MNQRIQLSDHFTTSRILRFAASPIIMMVFTSIYSVVDGFFVSNFAGKQAFAAVNLIMPFLQAFGCIGFMLGHRRQRSGCYDAGHRQQKARQ